MSISSFHMIKIQKKEKKVLTMEDYHKDQKFCIDCNRPINKNCHKSDIVNGKCQKCYIMSFNENSRRNHQKKRTKDRKNQRSFKSQLY